MTIKTQREEAARDKSRLIIGVWLFTIVSALSLLSESSASLLPASLLYMLLAFSIKLITAAWVSDKGGRGEGAGGRTG